MPIYQSNLLGFVGDPRDYIYSRVTTPIPARLNFVSYVKSVENQGILNACTSNSLVGACELILNANGQFENLSRIFNYYESRNHSSLIGDTGAYLRTAIIALKKKGLPTESKWPYAIENLDVAPPTEVYADASTRLLERYERIDSGITYIYSESETDTGSGLISASGFSIIGTQGYILDIKSALSEGFIVVIGLSINEIFRSISGNFISQYNNSWTGISNANPSIGGHAVYLVGYDDTYSSFIFANSWGQDWGFNGFGLLPYNSMTSCVQEAWVLKGFKGLNLLPSTFQNNTTTNPGFTSGGGYSDPTPPIYKLGVSSPTLFHGSQIVSTFTTIKWVQVLFVKGFTFSANLKVSYLALNNKLRFWVEETTGDTLKIVNLDSIIDAKVVTPETPLDTSINAYTVPVYSISGAIILLKVDITHADYLAFIQSGVLLENRITKTVVEPIDFLQFISAVKNLNGTINRDVGFSLFDSSYLQTFNKRVTLPQSFTGYIHFLNSGFSNGLWVKQIRMPGTGDIYFAVANSTTGDDADFGTPIIIAKNIGSFANPTLVFPLTVYTSIPNLKYFFTTNSYGYQNDTTSPFPYFIAKAKDDSALIFTMNVSAVNNNSLLPERASFDMSSVYLGLYKSGTFPNYGLGGNISDDPILPSTYILPPKNITGIRITYSGGLSSNSLRLKQRTSTTLPYTILQGQYPALDTSNHIYLSLAENNVADDPSNYGDEVDVTESGTYILTSKIGGTITVVTNRLLFNPYYNGSETLLFNTSEKDIFNPVTPGQAITGLVDYHCVYLKNRHPNITMTRIKIWSDLNCNTNLGSLTNDQYVQFALFDSQNRAGGPLDNVYISNYTQPPENVTFGFINAESESLIIDELLPNQCVALWVKRVIKPTSTIIKQDVFSYLRIKVMY